MKSLAVALLLSAAMAGGGPVAAEIRGPAVAGNFYAPQPEALRRAVSTYLETARPPLGPAPLALVAPHAGYLFSGQICADAFNQAAGHPYDLVVILGTNHTRAGFDGISVVPQGGYRTPLGMAAIDAAAAADLRTADPAVTHDPAVHVREHSVEVMVPFVQVLWPEAKILTAVLGRPGPDRCRTFGRALARVLAGRRALIVASSDLSHYPAYADARRVDRAVLEAMASLEAHRVGAAVDAWMDRGIAGLSTCACGQAAVLAAMAAARELGAGCGRIVSYANSGDTAVGTRDRVVGYGALAFFQATACSEPAAPAATEITGSADAPLTPAHKHHLLTLARRTLEQIFDSWTTPLARSPDPRLQQPQGAFVTLKKHGRLRGCIGHMAADRPLEQVVGAMAFQAAFRDRRFEALKRAELADIEIEISVLTPFRPIAAADRIKVGRDGVLLKKGDHQAVFLPQVAVEQGWSREETLAQLCRKAGLPADGWRDDARLYTFQAVIFDESGEP